jgi:hypothetical protein
VSEILEHWLEGKGLPDTLVIDGHIHIGEWPHNTTFRSADEAILKSEQLMDIHGIDAICALSGGYIFGNPDYRLGNDFLLKVWKGIPDRLIPFMSVNPNDTHRNIIDELDRMYSSGVRCIKLINAYQNNYPGVGPNLMAVYEYADSHRMLVLNHSWMDTDLAIIAQRFSGTDFICGHLRSGRIVKEMPNVYVNTWGFHSAGVLEKYISEIGYGKFVLGSDGFLNCLSVGIGPIVFARITDHEKRMILGITLARLLDKIGALPSSIKKKYPDFLCGG